MLTTGDRDFAEAVRAVCDDYSRRVWLFTPDSWSEAKGFSRGKPRIRSTFGRDDQGSMEVRRQLIVPGSRPKGEARRMVGQ